MTSISSTQYTWQKCIISIIVLLSLQRAAKSENNGILTFEFICYRNPDHLDKNGKKCDSIPSVNCDPYFTICISNQRIDGDIKVEKCGIYYQQTEAYNNHDLVCKTPTDNRGSLQNTIKKKIEFPRNTKNSIYVKIEATDSDQWTAYQTPIASFVTKLASQSPLDLSNIMYQDISMLRSEFKYSNIEASMKIRIGLQCAKHLFGKSCETVCQATETSTYTCSKYGERICKEGWKGPECLAKDLCVYRLCAENAECIEIGEVAKCQCNGQIGPQCYPNYNPCDINNCKNGGQCIPNRSSKTDFHCQCTISFLGSRCEIKLDECLEKPCLNNGTCEYDENQIRRCSCPDKFFGILCEKLQVDFVNDTTSNTTSHHQKMGNVNNKNWSLILVFIVFFSILLVAIAVTTVFFVIKRRRDHGYIFHKTFEQQVRMRNLEEKSPTLSVISNVYYVAQD